MSQTRPTYPDRERRRSIEAALDEALRVALPLMERRARRTEHGDHHT
jgi:hypothetical protein